MTHYYSYYLLSNQDLLEKVTSEKRLERRGQRNWQSRKTKSSSQGNSKGNSPETYYVCGQNGKRTSVGFVRQRKQEMRSERNKSESKTAYGLVNHDKRSLAERNERPTEGFKQNNNVI